MDKNKSINWYPGHMAKTKREIKEIISLMDIVIEIVDSRIPESSHIKDLEEFTLNKEVIIIFNKFDLCDKKETLKWKSHYEKLGFVVLTSNSKDNFDKKSIINCIEELMKEKNSIRKKKGLLPKKAKALIVGVPNVGKSTFINRIVNKKITEVGNKPGITKSLKTIKISEKVDLVDTPGILWPKIEDEETAYNLASMNIIKEEILPLDKVGIHILEKLSKFYKDILKRELGIEKFDISKIEECYREISEFKKFKIIDDEVDYDKINLYILNLIKSEKIKEITFDRINIL